LELVFSFLRRREEKKDEKMLGSFSQRRKLEVEMRKLSPTTERNSIRRSLRIRVS